MKTILGFKGQTGKDSLITMEEMLASLDRYGFEADSIDKANIMRVLQATQKNQLVSLALVSAKLNNVGQIPFCPDDHFQQSHDYEPGDEYNEYIQDI